MHHLFTPKAFRVENSPFLWHHSWSKTQELCWLIASTKYFCSHLCRLKGCRLFSPAEMQTLTPRVFFPSPFKTSHKSQLSQAMNLLECITWNWVIFPYRHLKRHFKASILWQQCMACFLLTRKTGSILRCKQSSSFYQPRFHHEAAHLLVCITLPKCLSISQPLVLKGPFVPQTSSRERGRTQWTELRECFGCEIQTTWKNRALINI